MILSLALTPVFETLFSMLVHVKLGPIEMRNMVPKRFQSGSKQRVLVIENDLLLGASIESLLVQEPTLEVIGFSPRNKKDLIDKILLLQPAVVILDEATHSNHSIWLLAMLKKHQDLRLIIVNADKNFIQVYHKQNVFLTQGSDLIKFCLKTKVPCSKEKGGN